MIGPFGNTFDALLALQEALEGHLSSDWLRGSTASRGPFPPINVFEQGDNFVAIIELPGMNRNDLEIQAKENTIRIAGRKTASYAEDISIHRRERVAGEFDRTLTLPIQINTERIRAEYRDGVLAIFVPRAESDKPRTIKIS